MFPLLKRNFACVAASLLCFAAIFLSSCASTPKREPVAPLSLLGSDDALYVCVPVDSHKEFVTRALIKLMALKKSDCEKITGRINDLYIGTKFGSGFEVSASGQFPPNYAKASLTEKNGWEAYTYRSYDYFVQKSSAMELSVPCAENIMLSYKISDLLDRFDAAQSGSAGAADENESYAQTKAFLESNGSRDILFVSSRPDLFFYAFTGTKLTLGVDKIKGTFFDVPQAAETYGVNLILEMADTRTIKAAIRLLQMALFGTPAKITQTGDSQISVTDITLTWDEILDLISK